MLDPLKQHVSTRPGTTINTGCLEVSVMSFGYKTGMTPQTNAVFDVRFLKNPFWVEELRPLTGLDPKVKSYVLEQPAAQEFLDSVIQMLRVLLPQLVELKIPDFSIAFGCTGGRHRSVALAEALATQLKLAYPEHKIKAQHRELAQEVCPGDKS